MAKQTLKILSWNTEKLMSIDRFPDKPKSPTLKDFADQAVTGYLEAIIKEQNAYIVCLVEIDARNEIFLTTTLKSKLGANWEFISSPSVRGGVEVIPGDKTNEKYVVFYDSSKVTLDVSVANAPQLATKQFSPHTADNIKNADFFRPPYFLRFSTVGGAPLEFGLLVLHLKANAIGEQRMLPNLTIVRNNAFPIFIAGDFNMKASTIIRGFSIPPNHDVLSPIVGNRNKTTVLKPLKEVTGKPIITDSVNYRTNNTGLDDIISLNNPTNNPVTSAAKKYDPKTGIVDLVDEYEVEFMENKSSQMLYQIPSDFLTRIDISDGSIENYGETLFEIPFSYDPEAPDPVIKNKVLYNAWARYMGGISDHLPVIMTIDIG
ncbi:MAG: hypothetical protein JKY48_07405 [Flavobacteriales bacterium]|nr:hypothetical protein [Flavobacteriales bacterium]